MLFSRLIETNSHIWDEYLHHEFVKKLENGSLKEENFLFYLKQDYIYLIHYAKCYARLALNAKNAGRTTLCNEISKLHYRRRN